MKARGIAAWPGWALPLLGATVFAAAAGWYVLGFMPQRRAIGERMIRQGLQLRAEVRGSSVLRWLQAGRQDASWWAETPTVIDLARGGRSAAELAHSRAILASFARSMHYWRAFVLDRRLGTVTSTYSGSLEQTDSSLVRDVLHTGDPRVAFHRHSDGRPGITFYAAVRDSTRASAISGVVALEADPREELFDLVGSRIADLPSGEAFLAAHAGDSVVILSPLLNDSAPPGTLRRPFAAPDLPSAAALRGEPLTRHFIDYRGRPVLAAAFRLTEPDWVLVVKVDENATLGPFERDLVRTGLLWGLAFLATFGAALAWWWGQRRAADAKLAHSLARNALLLDQANDAILFIGTDGRIREVNQQADAMYGYGPGALIGRTLDDLQDSEQPRAADLLTGEHRIGERHRTGRGRTIDVEISSRRVSVAGDSEIVALVRDVSERKAADARITRLNRALRTLRDVDEMILREHDPVRLRSEVCRILVEQGGVAIAWIGVAEPDGLVRPVAWAPAMAEAITTVVVRWDDTPEGRGPAGTAIREDQTVTVRDTANDDSAAAWRAMLARHGVHSMTSVPIRRSATEREVLAVQAIEPDAFDGDVIGLLEELAGDVGYALQALAERAARQAAEQRLAAFFAAGLFGTTIGSVDGGIVDANDEFLRIVGYTREDLREGRVDWRALTPAEFLPLDEAAHLEARARGASTPYEKQYIRKDGNRAWVLIGLLLQGERHEESIAFILDIGERKRAEEAQGALARQRDAVIERLRLQVERMPIALILESPDRVVLDWNPAAERMFGYSRDEALGRHSADLVASEEAPETEQALMADVATSGRTVYAMREAHTRDGRRITCAWHATALRAPSGEMTGILWMAEDVTDRARAEAELRRERNLLGRLSDTSPVGITIVDAAGHIVLANPRAQAILDLGPDDVPGRLYNAPAWRITAYDGSPFPEAALPFPQVRATLQPVLGVGHAIEWPDGRRVLLSVNAAPLIDAAGRFEGMVASIEDVTERAQAAEALRRSEESLRALNAELEQRVADRTARLDLANRELESFSSSISHDLRGPLRAVDGYSQMLLDEYAPRLDDEGRRYLDVIRSNTQRLGEMIADLLKFSRVGRQEMVRTRLDMAALVRSVWHEMTSDDQRERIAFRVAALPRAVGDGSLLRQVWMQLLSNAEKFTRPKADRVIDVGFREEPGQTVYFVRDNGVGFDAARTARLFAVFQRLHPAEEFEGKGIGLALVQRIVHRHGGSVWAEGAVGAGATISFSLPAGEGTDTP